MAQKKAPAKVQGIVWGSCIIILAVLWILDITGVFGDFKIFENFTFWSWASLIGGVFGIVSVILYGFSLLPMLLSVIAILYFLDFFKVLTFGFSKLIGPAVIIVLGLHIIISALQNKNSFREIKKDPEYVRASDRDREKEEQDKQ